MRMRELGFCDAMRDANLPPTVVHLTSDLEQTRIAVKRLLSKRKRPSALFCANNLLTRHILHSLQEIGLHPPNPIALVGFDDFETADLLNPGITTVRQPVEDLGRAAAETLFQILSEQNEANAPASAQTARLPRQTTLGVDLVVRGSCGAMPR